MWGTMHGADAPFRRVAHHGAEPWELTYATFLHLALLAYLVVPIPVVVPLVMWLVKKDESPFVDDHGREAVNFHITLTIYMVLTVPIALLTCGVGFVLVPAVYVLGLVGMILAAVAANRGEYYRYPMCLRFVG